MGDVTELLISWKNGSQTAFNTLIDIVYRELRKIALLQLRNNPISNSLQPTAIVHELYLKFLKLQRVDFENRRKFFSFSATCIRRMILEYIREAKVRKENCKVTLSEIENLIGTNKSMSEDDMILLDEALSELEVEDARAAKIIELKYFVSFTIQEIADELGFSTALVERDLAYAKDWLKRRMSYGKRQRQN